MKTALTIAGSDCSGGSGIQADTKTFAAHQIYATSVITAVVAENTCHVRKVEPLSPEIISEQITAVFEDIPPHAVKVGILPTREIVAAVADKLQEYSMPHVVVDPVMVATSGPLLIQEGAMQAIVDRILPHAEVFTPNLREAEAITGLTITNTEDMKKAARRIHEMGAKYVLVKGGHLPHDADAKDILFDGHSFYSYTAPRIQTNSTHGTGCTFSSAIASHLALGQMVPEAVSAAKQYMTGVITNAVPIGKGHGPTNHFYEFYPSWE